MRSTRATHTHPTGQGTPNPLQAGHGRCGTHLARRHRHTSVSAYWEGLLNAVHAPSEQAERDKAGVLNRLRAETKSLPKSVTEGLKTANLVSVDNIIDAIRSLSRGSTPGEDDMGLEFFLENIHDCLLYTSPSPRDS